MPEESAPTEAAADSEVTIDPTETPEPETAPADGEAAAVDGTAEPEEATEGEPAAEGESAEGEEDAAAGIELTDESVLKIGDSEHSFAEIREAVELVTEARGRITEANQAIVRSNGVLDAIREKPADALMGIFTSVFGGDKQKGYEATIKLAAQIINRHNELEAMPPGERRAMTLEQDLHETKSRLEAYEREQQAKQELELENKWAELITDGLKQAGLPESYIGRVAGKLAQAAEGGKKITMADAVAQVKADLKVERQNLMKTLDPDEIPEEVAQKLAAKRIEAAKKKRGMPASGAVAQEAEPEKTDGATSYDSTRFLETFARLK